MSDPRAFPLPPAGPLARALPWIVGGLLPIVAAAAFAWTTPPGRSPWFGILVPFALFPFAGLALAAIVHGRTVELVGPRLRVRRWPIPRDFERASLLLDQARVADIDREPGLRPVIKLAGTRMPGLRSGWFLTRDRRRAYVLTTTSPRMAVLPLSDGRLLMLGVERPEALLAALGDDGRARR